MAISTSWITGRIIVAIGACHSARACLSARHGECAADAVLAVLAVLAHAGGLEAAG